MEIEIKLAASGAIEMGKVEQNTLEDYQIILNNFPNNYIFSLETQRGPILVNKSNILTIKKRQ